LVENLVTARMKTLGMDRALFAERFDLRLQTVYTFGLSVSVVAAALLLALLFRGRKRPFGARVASRCTTSPSCTWPRSSSAW
jgi:hypothetical protein